LRIRYGVRIFCGERAICSVQRPSGIGHIPLKVEVLVRAKQGPQARLRDRWIPPDIRGFGQIGPRVDCDISIASIYRAVILLTFRGAGMRDRRPDRCVSVPCIRRGRAGG
jgi:hypothetical protein